MRLDLYLVERGIAPTRQKGRYLIDNSMIAVNGKIVTKPSFDITEKMTVELRGEQMPYVGRGGFKLEGALREFGIDVSGKVCVDVGASTGGFTDCLIKNGAKRVYAVDSGRDQLHEKLRSRDDVISMEGFNARELTESSLGERCDIAVADLSFISQTLIHKNISLVLNPGGYFISLIKPQFELSREYIGKNGIVKEKKLYDKVIKKVTESAENYGFIKKGLIESPIKGGDGNTEFLVCFQKINR